MFPAPKTLLCMSQKGDSSSRVCSRENYTLTTQLHIRMFFRGEQCLMRENHEKVEPCFQRTWNDPEPQDHWLHRKNFADF